jgi:hypothetical protein
MVCTPTSSFLWTLKGSVDNFAGGVDFGGLRLWLNPTSRATFPVMSIRIERNLLSLYNFNSCFLVMMLLCWSGEIPFSSFDCFSTKINLFKGSVGRPFYSGGGLLFIMFHCLRTMLLAVDEVFFSRGALRRFVLSFLFFF